VAGEKIMDGHVTRTTLSFCVTWVAEQI